MSCTIGANGVLRTSSRNSRRTRGSRWTSLGHRDPRVLREFLDEVRKTPLAPMVQLMLLRSLKQARYAGENLGHYGLATDWYTHFTSPIRRYPCLLYTSDAADEEAS